MSVRKRTWTTSKGEKKEAWIVDYVDQQGGRHMKHFPRKREADEYEATVRVHVREGIHTSSKMTVAEAGALWITEAQANNLERSTVESYQQHLRAHIEPLIGRVKLSELSIPTVSDFRNKLRAKGLSAPMVKRVVTDLGSILADAQEQGHVARNVVRDSNSNRKKKKRAQVERRQKGKLKIGVDIPTPDEIKAIIANLKGRWRPIILTAIFTGLRASELRGLRWQDVDLKQGELHVRQRADRYNQIGEPKTDAGTRSIPMPPYLINTLREWKLACPKKELDLAFPTGTGGIEAHSNIVTRGLQPAQIAAGVTVQTCDGEGKPAVDKDGRPALQAKYTGLHALRHFYASWCINRKADGGLELPLKVVQHRLGHSSIQMTADTYGHLFPRGDDGAELAEAERALLC